jgi:hypothetical protein
MISETASVTFGENENFLKNLPFSGRYSNIYSLIIGFFENLVKFRLIIILK